MFNQVSKKSRGFALALSLFLIVILATVCFAALNITTLDNRAATEDYKASRAFYAARAGVAYAKAQLTDSANVSLTSVLRYNEHLQLADGYISEEKFSITITPAADNPARAFRIWKVESTGYYADAARKIIAYLERETFAHYAYFTDQETNKSGQVIQFMGKDKITGAVHTNGHFTIAEHPQIGGQMVSANSDDTRYNERTGVYKRTDNKESTDNKDFYHAANNNYSSDRAIALDDSPDFSFAGGQAEVPLPRTTSSEIIEAAKMANTSFKGNYRIVFTEDGKAKYYKQVTKQGRTYYEGYPPHNNGTDKPEKTLDTTVRPGITMYVDGNVEIDGKVLGRCTLSSSGDTYICDDLQYVNPSNCVMGILSEKNIIVRANPNVKQDFYIDAILMALNGSFTVENYNTGVDRGELHVFGGIVQNKRGPVGQSWSGSTKRTGYAKDYVYDHKLETMPPLNFPFTGKFVIRYFIDKGSLGGV